MSPFENFKAALEAKGLDLRKQWEHRDGTMTLQYFLIYGATNRKHNDVFVMRWPDDGYQIYLQNPTNDISADVTAIIG